jgi:hypothetical protein
MEMVATRKLLQIFEVVYTSIVPNRLGTCILKAGDRKRRRNDETENRLNS